MADTITLSEVQQSFAAFAEASGTGVDLAYANGELMIARCVLPMPFEVRPGDLLKGGVAVRATIEEVEVRPYLLRLVCTNGLIMMRSAEGNCVARNHCSEAWLTEAFASASSPEALAAAVADVRNLAGSSLDRAFVLLAFVQRFRSYDSDMVREIIGRMIKDGSTGYSLLNAITSVARDTPNPETRWRLEAEGDGVLALLLAGPKARPACDALEFPGELLRGGRELQPA